MAYLPAKSVVAGAAVCIGVDGLVLTYACVVASLPPAAGRATGAGVSTLAVVGETIASGEVSAAVATDTAHAAGARVTAIAAHRLHRNGRVWQIGGMVAHVNRTAVATSSRVATLTAIGAVAARSAIGGHTAVAAVVVARIAAAAAGPAVATRRTTATRPARADDREQAAELQVGDLKLKAPGIATVTTGVAVLTRLGGINPGYAVGGRYVVKPGVAAVDPVGTDGRLGIGSIGNDKAIGARCAINDNIGCCCHDCL
ncbi:hypothetical protein FAES_0395 [Fibrella aestuarina BUZ 2]|uniref:Uncharacterized protein n=1 Tax=Fibrella aestuarina BUZ 2 TaxID=1166018 RepID=I0K2Q4_9BACT|nr:hypothetical protein FAES_0395 [Fibrella aestuarina BUZ 2]